jgi:hypothetical protein
MKRKTLILSLLFFAAKQFNSADIRKQYQTLALSPRIDHFSSVIEAKERADKRKISNRKIPKKSFSEDISFPQNENEQFERLHEAIEGILTPKEDWNYNMGPRYKTLLGTPRPAHLRGGNSPRISNHSNSSESDSNENYTSSENSTVSTKASTQ